MLEASVQAKSGNAAAANQTLAAVQSSSGSSLQAVLTRAQMAATAGDTSQVSSFWLPDTLQRAYAHNMYDNTCVPAV